MPIALEITFAVARSFVSSLLEDIDELSRAMDGTLGRDHYELIQKMVQVADGSQASTDGMSAKRSQEVCVTRDKSPNEADEDNALVVDVLQAVENVGIAEEQLSSPFLVV